MHKKGRLEDCGALLAVTSAATVANVVKAKQKSFLLYPPFSFSWEAEGVSTYGLLAAAIAATQKPPTYPTAREMLLHCVQVYLALSRRKCKFDIFKIRVSANKI